MRIRLKVDTSALEARFTGDRLRRRLSFAVVNAINNTAKLAQRAVRVQASDVFTLRAKRDFVLRNVAIIKPFASVGQARAFAEISVGQRRRLLLPSYEAGGDRPPFKGKSVAVPIGARPSKSADVPESLWIQRLRFRRQNARQFKAGARVRSGGGAGGKRAWLGALGTYLIPDVGIFQRLGAGAARILYVFAKRVRLRPTLKFVETVAGTADRHFARFLSEEIQKALGR